MERHTWSVYIVRCRTGEYYTGCTTDVSRRVEEHNRGRGSRFTRSRRPVTLVYREGCGSRSEALVRERAIKRMKREEKGRLIQSGSATRE